MSHSVVGTNRLAILAQARASEHHVDLIAIGNGTASRETWTSSRPSLVKLHARTEDGEDRRLGGRRLGLLGFGLRLAGTARSRREALRGAVSIARRPAGSTLAELVKVDPKSIGVGQYQHDLSEAKLSRSLDAVVEDCVNAVGVDLNTASAPLLARVSGVGGTLAQNIVTHRDGNGPFASAQGR